MYGPRRFECQGRADTAVSAYGCKYVEQLACAFFDPAKDGGWIHGGATSGELISEIGALLSSAELGQST